MKRAGKGSIWEYKINGVSKGIGTQEEIAKENDIKVITLRTRTTNLKNHKLILVKDSRPTYKMIVNDKVIAKGTIREITNHVPYSYSHVINVARGQRETKEFQLLRVG